MAAAKTLPRAVLPDSIAGYTSAMFPSALWNPLSFIASFLIVLFYIMFASDSEIIGMFVVLGQAHFFLTYLYQARAGKIGWTYLVLYVIAVSALFGAAAYSGDARAWTFVLAGSIFAVHFFADEMMMHSMPLTRSRKMLGASFVILYGGLLVREAYEIEMSPIVYLVAGVGVVPLVLERLRERSIQIPDMFMLSGIVVLFCIFLVPWSVSLASALGFIILFHYARWYLFMFFRFYTEAGKPRLYGYVRDIVLMNALAMAAYATYRLGGIEFLRYLFNPTYFYIWTVLHVLFSIRVPNHFSLKQWYGAHT